MFVYGNRIWTMTQDTLGHEIRRWNVYDKQDTLFWIWKELWTLKSSFTSADIIGFTGSTELNNRLSSQNQRKDYNFDSLVNESWTGPLCVCVCVCVCVGGGGGGGGGQISNAPPNQMPPPQPQF
jgi:hypothetical protein